MISAFVDPGDAVVVPCPTYGLYAQACTVAGAEVHRVDAPRPSLAFDLEAIAHTAIDVDAKLVWICDPNNPTGLRLRAGEWAEFLDALPAGCVVVADEAYVDYIEPAQRIDRLADIRAERPVIVLLELDGHDDLKVADALAGQVARPSRHRVWPAGLHPRHDRRHGRDGPRRRQARRDVRPLTGIPGRAA